MHAGPLRGVRIIEISSYVAAPLAGMLCAQLGADVIRIDPPGGAADRTRWPLAPSGTSLYWAGLNKGKRSVVVDLRTGRGRRLVGELLAGSGPSGGIPADQRPRAPGSGLRRPGPLPTRPHPRSDRRHPGRWLGRRLHVNAASGFAEVTGPGREAGPVNHVLPAWDIACGLHAALGVLAALRHRDATGSGQTVRLALQDVATAMASHLGFLAEAELGGTREPIGNDVFGTYGTDFETAEGRRVMIVALTGRHWRELQDRTGFGPVLAGIEQAMGADFAEESERFRHREVITAVLRPWFRARTVREVAAALAGTSVLWAPFRSFAESVADQAGSLDVIAQPGVGVVHAARSVLRMSASGPGPARPAPELGADTRTVLAELGGLTDAETTELVRGGTVVDATNDDGSGPAAAPAGGAVPRTVRGHGPDRAGTGARP